LLDRFLAKVCIAHIATNQDAFASLFFDLTFGFIRVLVFLKVNDCNVGAFFRERDCNGATDPAIATSDDSDFVPQFSAALMFFVLGPGSWLHPVFAARLPSLVLRRLKLLFFRHNTSVRRELRYTISGGAFACALLFSRRRSAIAQSVASLRVSRASTTLSGKLIDGSRV
jgi:hypothetical protein